MPNQGVLLSVDVKNILKVWNLSNLSLKLELKIPQQNEEKSSLITCLYIPPELTN